LKVVQTILDNGITAVGNIGKGWPRRAEGAEGFAA
jgi:hypothetical protein